MITVLLIAISYIAAQMMSDIASLRIVTILGFSMDAGTLIYPITFTLRDLIHKVAGIKIARVIIIAAAVVNIFMALLFWLVSRLPADLSIGPQTEFVAVLSPVWRIVFASILAEVVSELVDTEAYRIWTERITTRFQWLRVLVSNSFSVPLDSIIFCWIAFGGVLPAAVVWSILASNVIVKGATTILSLPMIYLVKDNHHA